MLGLLLNLIYVCLALAALPVVAWKRLRTGKYRRGWSQKLLGRLPQLSNLNSQPTIWLHAVSVGEVLQLRQIVERIQRQRPDARVLVTTTTETGYDVARDKLAGCEVAFFPLDFTWSVRTALDRVQPDLVCLVELELWPNFIHEVRHRGIPLVLINGRLSENSFRGYRRIRLLVRSCLSCFDAIAVQAEEYRERFLALGAPPERTAVTGSIKFDGVNTQRDNPRTRSLREWTGFVSGEPVLIAGSTQDPEEELVLGIYSRLRKEHPGLRLIIVPRHPERGTDIARLIEKHGYTAVRRSQASSGSQHSTLSTQLPIPLLDTVGELGACWGLADVAFVGGSFGNRGGQNMLEPAAYGAAVCFGPNTRNFRPIVEMLHAADAARTVHNSAELESFIDRMLRDTVERKELGQRAQQLVLAQQGATDRTVRILLDALRELPQQRMRAA